MFGLMSNYFGGLLGFFIFIAVAIGPTKLPTLNITRWLSAYRLTHYTSLNVRTA